MARAPGVPDQSLALEHDLALAQRLAYLAAEIALPLFQRGVAVRRKADASPVTEADLTVERELVDVLARERPDDAVIGEEFGVRGRSARRWIIDPIDGTHHFVAERPNWGTHVALEQDGEIVLGVITRPVLDRRWWAARGGGAHRSALAEPGPPTRLRTSGVTALRDSRVSVWAHEGDETLERLKRSGARIDTDFGALLRLAEGELEVLIDTTGKVWDRAPAIVLIEEAGGRYSDGLGGRRPDVGQGRFSNALVAAELERVLAG